jgi:phosphate starvation-inducible protein PhoH and related proteins
MTTKRRRKKNKVEDTTQTANVVNTGPKLKIKFEPRTENQVIYLRSIIENDITFCTGPSGSGKTACAVFAACSCLIQGLVDKIIVTRPMVQCGKGLGFLTGDLASKFNPYASPVIETLQEFLGVQTYNNFVKDGTITIEPLELLRGRNFHKTFVVADEMQNATYEQIKLLLTRHGQQSKTLVTGDPKQLDLYYNDLNLVIERLTKLHNDGVGIVRLERKDIQRSGIIGKILECLED